MLKNYLLTSLLCFSLTSPAFASGIPVYDASTFTQMVTQLNQMSKDYQKQLDQLEQAVKQANAITGTRDMGSLANGAAQSDLRRYLPNTWEETMHMMSAGGLGTTATGTQGIYSNLLSAYKPLSGSSLMASDPSGTMSKAFDRRSNTTYAAMATAEQSYNSVEGHIGTYEDMLGELNNTTDLKASVDLQSRISAENGLIMSDLLRLNAVQMQQKSAEDNQSLVNAARASAANKYDASKAANIFKEEE
jgi:type IV secretion system protein VirB5